MRLHRVSGTPYMIRIDVPACWEPFARKNSIADEMRQLLWYVELRVGWGVWCTRINPTLGTLGVNLEGQRQDVWVAHSESLLEQFILEYSQHVHFQSFGLLPPNSNMT